MSLAFEVAKTVLHAEEIVRLSKPILLEQRAIVRNDVYDTVDVPLTVSHDCYSVDIPTFFDVVTFAKFAPCSSTYKYRINHGEWVDVSQNSEIVEKDFDIESIDVSNDIGSGVLNIYLEGVRSGSGGV